MDILDKYPSTLANSVHDEPVQPYNRIVSQPQPGIRLVEPMTDVFTIAYVRPKDVAFSEGDPIVVKTIYGIPYPATYIGKDGDTRSLIEKQGKLITAFNYTIYPA